MLARRVRAPLPPPVRRGRRGIVGAAKTPALQAVLTVSVASVVGDVTQEELQGWIQAACAHYHTFRGGHVGYLRIVGKMTLPVVEVGDES